MVILTSRVGLVTGREFCYVHALDLVSAECVADFPSRGLGKMIDRQQSGILAYWRLLRPSHWTKNVFVLAALVFGGKLFGPWETVRPAIGRSLWTFVAFCLASSAMYILNGLIDAAADRTHPRKSHRPLAAGQIERSNAVGLLGACVGLSLGICGLVLGGQVLITVFAYMVLLSLYSFGLKKVLILDGIIIATGFCLRAVAGAVALEVTISPWLIICTFALCLFLAFSKRRSEIALLGRDATAFRQTLGAYSPELLAHLLNVTSGLAVVCFLLYAMDERTYALFGNHYLVYTTPMVLFCVFRFSALSQQGQYSGPVELIWRDRPFQIGAVLWALACYGIVYQAQLRTLLFP